jgi:hypothetical protein
VLLRRGSGGHEIESSPLSPSFDGGTSYGSMNTDIVEVEVGDEEESFMQKVSNH